MTSVFAAARLPVCSTDGALCGFHPVEMAATVLGRLIREADMEVEDIDEVWVGCAEPVGGQGADVARAAVLSAGWPERVSGVTVDAAECSGMAALHAAVAAVESGQVRHAVVIGVSSSSMIPPGASSLGRTYGRPWSDGPALRYGAAGGLPSPHRGAEVAAEIGGFGRIEQDLVMRRSLLRRADRARSGAIVEVTARVPARSRTGRGDKVAADVLREFPGDLARLAPAFEPDGTVTAATFSPPADGCGGLLIGPRSPTSRCRVIATGRAGGDPRIPHGGAVAAVADALDRAGLMQSDVVRWEIVESSAAALLCICEALGIDPASVNPDGGALATGDSGAAEEIRLAVDVFDSADPAGPVVALVSGPTGAAATVLEIVACDPDRTTGN